MIFSGIGDNVAAFILLCGSCWACDVKRFEEGNVDDVDVVVVGVVETNDGCESGLSKGIDGSSNKGIKYTPFSLLAIRLEESSTA